MPLLLNLRHLDAHSLRLQGDLPVEELDIDTCDETIRLKQPLRYELEAQKLPEGLLVQGRLRLPLECQCVRCLKPFRYPLELADWTVHLPFKGEDAVTISNDCVDLTPHIREDILLEFPQHPLCEAECRGLPKTDWGRAKNTGGAGQPETGSPAWNELNKLKL